MRAVVNEIKEIRWLKLFKDFIFLLLMPFFSLIFVIIGAFAVFQFYEIFVERTYVAGEFLWWFGPFWQGMLSLMIGAPMTFFYSYYCLQKIMKSSVGLEYDHAKYVCILFFIVSCMGIFDFHNLIIGLIDAVLVMLALIFAYKKADKKTRM